MDEIFYRPLHNEIEFMSQVISVRDIQEMMRNGQDVQNPPADAIVTPSARDFLHESASQRRRASQSARANGLPLRPATSSRRQPRN